MSKPTLLFPVPRSYAEAAGSIADEDAPVIVAVDSELPPQGYRIHAEAGSISVHHCDPAGLRYALQTLDQLRASGTLARTAVTIEDWPDFAVRGVMLDISRDRVPTRRTLRRYVELLALSRINQLELYMEHAFAYSGHEAVWSHASALTPADMRWLDDLCAAAGISLVANQNTFGHMWRWLELEQYASRAEMPEGFELFGRRRVPSTLQPTEENLELVGGLLTELTATLRARRVNIGADEPFELGRGHSQAEFERRGGGAVYFDYVSKTMQPLLEQGYEVEFWADIFGNYPELMRAVPKGAIPVVWQYDSPALTRAVWEISTPEQRDDWKSVHLDMEALREGFSARAKALIDAKIPFWVAPGTSTWQSFVGRMDNAIDNMIDAAEVGLANDSAGYINTVWGDHGHFDPPAVSFGPIAFGGAISWGLEGNRDIDIIDVLDRYVFDDGAGVLGGILSRIGETTKLLDAPLLNASLFFVVLLRGGDLDGLPPVSPESLATVDAILATALDDLEIARPASADGDVVIREVRQAIRFARLGVAVLKADGVAGMSPAEARNLGSLLEDLIVEQRSCWLLRSRLGGLDDSIARMSELRSALAVRAAA